MHLKFTEQRISNSTDLALTAATEELSAMYKTYESAMATGVPITYAAMTKATHVAVDSLVGFELNSEENRQKKSDFLSQLKQVLEPQPTKWDAPVN